MVKVSRIAYEGYGVLRGSASKGEDKGHDKGKVGEGVQKAGGEDGVLGVYIGRIDTGEGDRVCGECAGL